MYSTEPAAQEATAGEAAAAGPPDPVPAAGYAHLLATQYSALVAVLAPGFPLRTRSNKPGNRLMLFRTAVIRALRVIWRAVQHGPATNGPLASSAASLSTLSQY